MGELSLLLVVGVIAAFLGAASIRVPREDERLVVLRLGRCVGVVGPGCAFLLPIIDKGIRVNLTERVAGWRGMSRGEVDARIVEVVLGETKAA